MLPNILIKYRLGNAFDLYTSRKEELQAQGFPAPEPHEIPQCDTGFGTPSCTRARGLSLPIVKLKHISANAVYLELFEVLNKNDVIWQLGRSAAYSDQGYILLGFALENITGIPYTELITKTIVEEVGLAATSFDTPDLSEIMIPVGSGSAFAAIDFGNFKA